VLDVALHLVRVRRAGAGTLAVGAAPAREQADAGRALVARDEVGEIAVLRAAVLVRHARQAQARAELEQHALERAHVAVRRQHRLADGVGGAVGVGDRAV
jgi:cytochrome c-type biogenesis protein CcmH/NrfG